MSRRVCQGIKAIEKDIADFEHTVSQVQKVKPGRNKPSMHNVKRDKQLKAIVTEPLTEKSRDKVQSREIHKQVLENNNAMVVITVRTKHSHVSRKRNKISLSPSRSKQEMRSAPKAERKSSHKAVVSNAEAATTTNKEREVKGLPWSSLLNNRQLDYETTSSVYSGCTQRNNLHSDRRSTTESKYIYKNNCSTYSQRRNYELKACVDQSVQCTEPQCECDKGDPIGALKSLFSDVLSMLQKGREDGQKNVNTWRSGDEEEPVRLPRQTDAVFAPLHPEKASPPDVISAPVPVLPGPMHQQLEVTNALLEQTYRDVAMKCEEYRKERDQLRQEVIQQQKKVQTLMEKEKDHLLVINTLQADIVDSKAVHAHEPLEMELELLRLQRHKYQMLAERKEKEILRYRQELQSIQEVIEQQLDNCKLMHHKVWSDKPVCSSPTSSVISLGTLESWQKISCISPSNGSDPGVVLGVPAAISDTESMQKMRKELSRVFEEIRHSRVPLPSPPRTYTDLNDSQWTDLSVETAK